MSACDKLSHRKANIPRDPHSCEAVFLLADTQTFQHRTIYWTGPPALILMSAAS